jgi:hypothetical protein
MPTYKSDKKLGIKTTSDPSMLLQGGVVDRSVAVEQVLIENKPNILAKLEKKAEKVEKTKKPESSNPENDKVSQKKYDYNQFYKYESNLSKKLNFILVFIVLIFGFNIFLLTREVQPAISSAVDTKEIAGVFAQDANQNQSTKVTNSTSSSDSSIKIIDTFQSNPALVDLGFKVDIGKNYIANYDDPNCQTPIVPPSVNGCGFAILLSGLGIPESGVAYKSIDIEANFKGQDNKIQIDQKNYEKGTFTKTIGILSSQSPNNKIVLPSNIPSSDTLYLRFWIKSGTVSISQISVDYYFIDDLKKVNLSFENPIETTSETGTIYQDADENSAFDGAVDQKWECQANFVGVMPVKIEKTATMTLSRDDVCYTATPPQAWQNDDKALALPPGKWLLVLEDGTSFAFEVKNDAESFDIKLKN